MDKLKIMVVDDESRMRKLVKDFLKKKDFEVIEAADGEEALDIFFKDKSISLIICDVMMPKINGFDVVKEIRQYSQVPIIMLTAKVEDTDKIMGLTIGADDYITKPFNPLEVVARVKTQLRRYVRYNNAACEKKEVSVAEYDIRGLVINQDTHKCSLYGTEIVLTPIEFSILWYLCENKGKVIPSEELFENVWKEKFLDNNNTVMAHIGRLREKLGEPAKNPKFIKTVWGVGYTIE